MLQVRTSIRTCFRIRRTAIILRGLSSLTGMVSRTNSEWFRYDLVTIIVNASLGIQLDRYQYPHKQIEKVHFCQDDCLLLPCRLSRKLLNNDFNQQITRQLVRSYEEIRITSDELRIVYSNLMALNPKMIIANIEENVLESHCYLVKIYWTYVLSVYATYYVCAEKNAVIPPLNIKHLHIVNNDICVNVDSMSGCRNDYSFVHFLDKLKR